MECLDPLAWCLYYVLHAITICDGSRFDVADLARRSWRQLRTRKAARILAAGLTLVVYVKLRSFLAVDQLVRMYREVIHYPPTLLFPCQLLLSLILILTLLNTPVMGGLLRLQLDVAAAFMVAPTM